MKKLFIIGAGGFGREVLDYARDVKENNSQIEWDIEGFLDDNLDSLQNYHCGVKVVESIKGHVVSEENLYICAIGDTIIKSNICKELKAQGANFVNIIHPTARIGRSCEMGEGNVICPNACLTTDVVLGSYIFINCHANCGHDSKISDYCTVSPFCDITGFVQLGKGAFLGSHSSVCPSVQIGDFAKIGAGAIVISNITSNCTAVGVPAKVVKQSHNDVNL